MFAGGIVDLVNKGCITNNRKTINKGKIIGSFLIGTRTLYDFVDNNPYVGKSLNSYKLCDRHCIIITVTGDRFLHQNMA
jgi:acyl-CoA hydrolase